jgi:hypothetical protein
VLLVAAARRRTKPSASCARVFAEPPAARHRPYLALTGCPAPRLYATRYLSQNAVFPRAADLPGGGPRERRGKEDAPHEVLAVGCTGADRPRSRPRGVRAEPEIAPRHLLGRRSQSSSEMPVSPLAIGPSLSEWTPLLPNTQNAPTRLCIRVCAHAHLRVRSRHACYMLHGK